MEKNTVTRTFSFGTICDGAKAVYSDDFFAERRHSSAGIRALLWASNSAKLFCSIGSDSQTSQENIFPNILTPGSIPQFTIPSLSVQSSFRCSDSNEEAEDGEESEVGCGISEQDSSGFASLPFCSSSTSSSSISLAPSDRRAERSVSDPLNHRRMSLLQREMSFPCSHKEAQQQCLDPASRAALSLPHLSKVTTPYGFITLSQSPQMVSEEALLCSAGLRRFNKDEESVCCLSKALMTRTGDANVKGSSSHLSAIQQQPSDNSSNTHTKGGLGKSSAETSVSASGSSSVKPRRAPDGKLKRRLCDIIRKHFTSHH